MALCINICRAVFNQQKVIVFIFYAVGRIKAKMGPLNGCPKYGEKNSRYQIGYSR